MTTPASRLRTLINNPEILVLPGVFDGYSARVVEASGFDAAFVTGAGVSEASLGWADRGIMGFEENLRVCRALVGCCGLPLLADADTGYGNAVNVHFTITGFERAGLAGAMIEDQIWPKRCGHMADKQVISMEEAGDKIRAACAARRDPDFVIKSRTDALATHGLDEVIRRLNHYAEAGADLLFADAVTSVEEIRSVVVSVDKPLCVNMGFGIRQRSTTPLLSARQLEDLGVSVVIYPRLLSSSGLRGMMRGMEVLKESLVSGLPIDRPDLMVSFEDLNAMMGMEVLEALERDYVPSR